MKKSTQNANREQNDDSDEEFGRTVISEYDYSNKARLRNQLR